VRVCCPSLLPSSRCRAPPAQHRHTDN
jgi:hypothetical protein